MNASIWIFKNYKGRPGFFLYLTIGSEGYTGLSYVIRSLYQGERKSVKLRNELDRPYGKHVSMRSAHS
jgi:hypothetical protein